MPSGSVNANKTHCKNGHAFTPENTYVGKSGSRTCRACKRVWQREYVDAINQREVTVSSKFCSRCKTTKSKEEFNRSRASRDGLHWNCKDCTRSNALKREYGITEADYQRFFEKQNGVCGICGNPERDSVGRRLAVDHNHETGEVRGLLCRLCNTGIGQLRTREMLEAAIAWIEE